MKIQDHYEFPECDHRRLPSSSDWKDGARWSDLSSRYSAGRKVGSPAGFYFARSVEHSPGVYTKVSAADGTTRPAAGWVGQDGRARKLRDAAVTEARCPVGAAVCVHAKGMKEPWCLVASDAVASSRQIIDLYAKRWTVEPSFRDTKDLRFGMGLSAVRIGDPQRRDRLLLLNAFAIVLLTLLGAAGESLGMDRHLKSNTVKTRSHSLFRQGCMLYDLIPNMPEHRLKPLIQRYAEILQQSRVITETFAIV